jgi:hypothetical protein
MIYKFCMYLNIGGNYYHLFGLLYSHYTSRTVFVRDISPEDGSKRIRSELEANGIE